MAKLTRAQLDTIIANNFPDNTSEDITPEKLREFASAVVESCSNDEDDVIVSGITPGSTNVIVHGTPQVPELVVNEAYIVRFVFSRADQYSSEHNEDRQLFYSTEWRF